MHRIFFITIQFHFFALSRIFNSIMNHKNVDSTKTPTHTTFCIAPPASAESSAVREELPGSRTTYFQFYTPSLFSLTWLVVFFPLSPLWRMAVGRVCPPPLSGLGGVLFSPPLNEDVRTATGWRRLQHILWRDGCLPVRLFPLCLCSNMLTCVLSFRLCFSIGLGLVSLGVWVEMDCMKMQNCDL